jgi:hypothetical protein
VELLGAGVGRCRENFVKIVPGSIQAEMIDFRHRTGVSQLAVMLSTHCMEIGLSVRSLSQDLVGL